MIRFWITANPRPDMTRDEFDFEWGVIHPSLMMLTGSVDAFQRYAQHRAVEGVSNADVVHPLADQSWYALSDHWLNTFEDLSGAMSGNYHRRMSPHEFSDGEHILELTEGEIIYDQDVPFTGRGGIKLIQFVKRDSALGQEEFASRWRSEYAENLVAELGSRRQLLRRYVQNPQLPLDPAIFAGTLFEAGGCQTYSGIDELWFDDLESLKAAAADPRSAEALRGAGLLAAEGSFSMAVVERVVFDRTGSEPRQLAVLDPASLEAQCVASEREPGEWNTVQKVTAR